MTALVARDGSVWTSTEDGLNRWKNGEISIYRASASSQPAGLANSEEVHRSVREIVDRGLADNQVGSLRGRCRPHLGVRFSRDFPLRERPFPPSGGRRPADG